MSLAPAEQRALDKIEDSLCRSDPRLDRMLTRFAVPVFSGGLVVLVHRSRRFRLLTVLIFALATIAVLVMAALHSPPAPVPCAATSATAPAIVGTQASSCTSAQHQDHTASTTQGGTAGLPGDLGTP